MTTELDATVDRYFQSGRGAQVLEQRWGQIIPDISGGAGTLTSLPSDPEDGQTIFYKVESGVIWQLRYNANEGQPNTYPWEFVGGTPWVSEDYGNTRSTAATHSSWQDISPNPAITVPEAGDYWIILEATADTGDTGSGVREQPQATVRINTAAEVTFLLAITTATAAGDRIQATMTARRLLTALTSGDAINSRWREAQNQGCNFANRALHVWPKRVGTP